MVGAISALLSCNKARSGPKDCFKSNLSAKENNIFGRSFEERHANL